jgi:hypothetical protein
MKHSKHRGHPHDGRHDGSADHMEHHKPHMAEKHHGHHSNILNFKHVGMSQAHGIKK